MLSNDNNVGFVTIMTPLGYLPFSFLFRRPNNIYLNIPGSIVKQRAGVGPLCPFLALLRLAIDTHSVSESIKFHGWHDEASAR